MATHLTHKVGSRGVLRYLLASNLLYLRLFTNNFTPVITDVAAAFTEATYPGYAAKNLTLADVDADGFDANWNYFTLSNNNLFLCTGTSGLPQTVYGWFITGNLEGTGPLVICSNKYTTPIVIAATNDFVKTNQGLYVGDLTNV